MSIYYNNIPADEQQAIDAFLAKEHAAGSPEATIARMLDNVKQAGLRARKGAVIAFGAPSNNPPASALNT